jgi:hypothetical protein
VQIIHRINKVKCNGLTNKIDGQSFGRNISISRPILEVFGGLWEIVQQKLPLNSDNICSPQALSPLGFVVEIPPKVIHLHQPRMSSQIVKWKNPQIVLRNAIVSQIFNPKI